MALAELLVSYEMEFLRLSEENEQHTVQLEKINHELEVLSRIDPLTNIPNRRAFFSAYGREWKRAAREKRPISVLMVDIDYFKPYNDCYGHAAGDGCLQAVAQRLASIATRPGDMTARYGGEEFILMLPNTDQDHARMVAEHLCTSICDLNIEHLHSKVHEHVTISVGLADAVPIPNQDEHDLIKLADQALYAAKDNGRNRVAVDGSVAR